ncbi:hypothetical protein SLEP1_g53940 [Rubroshorea leprosula]|uniref:Uncharacterized protein n=1 Tax=Rubroshorea leprosula TaxID=152421 RepID=A0AAV5MAT7_9ROSI|nr:hypothetical protein SLEP1_g53940 [Rubroshorea leprosula]
MHKFIFFHEELRVEEEILHRMWLVDLEWHNRLPCFQEKRLMWVEDPEGHKMWVEDLKGHNPLPKVVEPSALLLSLEVILLISLVPLSL